MVAVRSHEADRFVDKPPDGISIFLVFGPDTGLVSERVTKILTNLISDRHDPFQMVSLAGDDVADDPGLLIDEARTIGLFQTRRAIHVSLGRKSIVEPLKLLTQDSPKDCIIVVSAGQLRPEAPVRTLCARAKAAAAIECYPDDERDLARLIDEQAHQSSIRVSKEAKIALIASLGADRLTTRSELDKLFLYRHGAQEISEDDIYTIVADAAGHGFDDAVDAAFQGKIKEASEIYSGVAETGENPNALIGACIRRCLLLHRMALERENGVAPDAVLEKFGQMRLPPRRRSAIGAQMRAWSSKRALSMLSRLDEMALRIRRETALDFELGARALWMIAASRQ